MYLRADLEVDALMMVELYQSDRPKNSLRARLTWHAPVLAASVFATIFAGLSCEHATDESHTPGLVPSRGKVDRNDALRSVRLSGVVLDRNGSPVVGATVMVEPSMRRLSEVRTDGLGRFTAEVCYGRASSPRVRLRVHAAGFVPALTDVTLPESPQEELHLGPLVLSRGRIIRGRVSDHLGSPVAAQVRFYSEDGEFVEATTSGIAGEFEARALPVGVVLAFVQPIETSPRLPSKVFEVKAADTKLDATLPMGVRVVVVVESRVPRSESRLLGVAALRMEYHESRRRCCALSRFPLMSWNCLHIVAASKIERGHATFDGLAPGSYQLLVTSIDGTTVRHELEISPIDVGTARLIKVDAP